MSNRQPWLLDSYCIRNRLNKTIFTHQQQLLHYSTIVNNNPNNNQNDEEKRKSSSSQARIILILMGLALCVLDGSLYYTQYDQLEHSNIIEEGNLTDGKLCKIVGKINSNKVLKLDDSIESQEPVLIYEISKDSGKILFVKSRRRERLRCYSSDLEVKFAFGIPSKEWFDSNNDLTESLKVELLPNCKIVMGPTKEYSENIRDYNGHIETVMRMNRDSNIKFQPIIKLFALFDAQIIQKVLNKDDQVILIGKVDPERRLFKCETLISPNERRLYDDINHELAITSVCAAVCFALGILIGSL